MAMNLKSLATVKRAPNIFLYPKALTKTTKLSMLLATAINSWAHLDAQLGWSLAMLLGGNADVGLAMYAALRSAPAQNSTVEAVAKLRLLSDDFQLFMALTRLAGKAQSDRNLLAHGIWGFAAEMQDTLLLMPSKPATEWQAERAMKVDNPWNRGLLIQPVKLDLTQVFQVRAEDLEELTDRIERIMAYIYTFWNPQRPKQPKDTDADRRARLSSEPEIRAELLRPRKDRRNGP
jgi:hypothetical protein